MDLFEAKEFFTDLYKGKELKYEFDNHCMRTIEIVHTESLPHLINHVEYNKVKITPDGVEPFYIPIAPHRMNISIAEIRKYLSSNSDSYIHPQMKEEYGKASEETRKKMSEEIRNLSGFTDEQLNEKMKV